MTHVGEPVGVGGEEEEEGGALEDVEDVAVLARVQQHAVRAVQELHRRRHAARVVVCLSPTQGSYSRTRSASCSRALGAPARDDATREESDCHGEEAGTRWRECSSPSPASRLTSHSPRMLELRTQNRAYGELA